MSNLLDYSSNDLSNPTGYSLIASRGATSYQVTSASPCGNTSSSGIITSGLVLNLDAANTNSYPGNGTTWSDLSGNGNNATLANGTTYSCTNGGAIVFDGVNDYARITTFNNTPQSTLTLLYWVKYTQEGYIAQQSRNASDANTEWMFSISNNKLRFWDYDNGFAYNYVSANTTLSKNIWYQVGFVKDQTSGIFYLNGVQNGTATAALNATYGNNDYVMGSDYRASYAYFGGKMAQVSIYNRALSSSEVLQNFNAMRGRYGI